MGFSFTGGGSDKSLSPSIQGGNSGVTLGGDPYSALAGQAINAYAQYEGAKLNAKAQKEANEKNIQLAKDQMAFQEAMSNSAYQRATEDMRKAGINPMLAFQQGGASTPQGASAHVESTKMGDAISNSASAVVDLWQRRANVAQTYQATQQSKAQEKLIQAQTNNANVDTILKSKDVPQAEAKVKLMKRLVPYAEKTMDVIDSSAKGVGNLLTAPIKVNYPKRN